jgi:hypothetical protein
LFRAGPPPWLVTPVPPTARGGGGLPQGIFITLRFLFDIAVTCAGVALVAWKRRQTAQE